MHIFLFQVFQNILCLFLTSLKAEKWNLKEVFGGIFFSLNFNFLSLIWIYKLFLSLINQNTSFCYTLNNKIFCPSSCLLSPGGNLGVSFLPSMKNPGHASGWCCLLNIWVYSEHLAFICVAVDLELNSFIISSQKTIFNMVSIYDIKELYLSTRFLSFSMRNVFI